MIPCSFGRTSTRTNDRLDDLLSIKIFRLGIEQIKEDIMMRILTVEDGMKLQQMFKMVKTRNNCKYLDMMMKLINQRISRFISMYIQCDIVTRRSMVNLSHELTNERRGR
jgi:hypothetical protein